MWSVRLFTPLKRTKAATWWGIVGIVERSDAHISSIK